METKYNNQTLNGINEDIFDELLTIESLIKTTVNNCLNKEHSALYYTGENITKQLSEERNDYINVLTIALERVKHVQMLNDEIEEIILESII